MNGPDIFARSLSSTSILDKFGNSWQYHSRSDRHSKIACWAILFDLLESCRLFRKHVESGEVGFGINHEMCDFKNNRKKNLDLVICKPAEGPVPTRTFASMARDFGVQLTNGEAARLSCLPTFRQRRVGAVLLALEAKACMTEHIKARPRLYDELSSSYQTILGDTKNAIAAAFVTINVADTFISPDRNRRSLQERPPDANRHKQPKVAFDVVDKIKELPRRSNEDENGFDAIGVCMINCRNDGSKVDIVEEFSDGYCLDAILYYDTMIDRIAHWYSTRFRSI